MTLRFLHVLESLAPGGMETTFLNMLRVFNAADPAIAHDVLAMAGGALEPQYRETAANVIIASDRDSLDRVLGQPYDLVHILFERCAYRLLPQLLSRSAVPVVYGKGYDMGGMYRLNDGLEWQPDASMLAAVDGVTFTTPELAEGFSVPDGRGTVLRKAADIAAFIGLPQADLSTAPRIVCVANLHPRKRLGDLLQAFAFVRRAVPVAELRFVGGGNELERARLRGLADDLGLGTAVTFAGTVGDVAGEIASARVVALPSACEGVPTAILEGMAAARPIVATRVGHVSSIVDDGVEGFLIDVGDVSALADRLTRLLSNRVLARAMGQAARRRAMRHDVREVARELMGALMKAARVRHDVRVAS